MFIKALLPKPVWDLNDMHSKMHSSDLQRMRFGRGGLRTSRADNNQHFVYDQRNSKGRGPHLTARDFDLGEGFQRSGSYPKLTLNGVSTVST